MTFDRYLLRSFLHVFVVCFITSFGLMVVIDLFENLDEFINENGGKMRLQVVQAIFQFYAYRAIFFFDQGGAVMAVASAMVVLILFQRNGELHPLLAAGISMYRLLLPLVAGVIGVSVLLIIATTVGDEIIKLRDMEHDTSIVVTHQIRDAFYVATHEAIT